MRAGRALLLAVALLGDAGTALAQTLPCTPANQRRGVCGCIQTSTGTVCPGGPGPGAITPAPPPPPDPQAVQQEQERRAHDLNEQGIADFQRGDYEAAVQRFREAHALLPDRAIETSLRRALEARQVVLLTTRIARTQAQKNAHRARVIERLRVPASAEPTDVPTLRRRLRERYAISVQTLPARLREAREHALAEEGIEAVWERLWELVAAPPLERAGVDADGMKTFVEVQASIVPFARDELGTLPAIVNALAKGTARDLRALETLVTRNYCTFATETETKIEPLPATATLMDRFLGPCP